jgi:hypothetical protein
MVIARRAALRPLPYRFWTRLRDKRKGRLDANKGIPVLSDQEFPAAIKQPGATPPQKIVPSAFLLELENLATEREHALRRESGQASERLHERIRETQLAGRELESRLEQANSRLRIIIDKWQQSGLDYCRTNEEKLNATLVRRRRIAERDKELAPLDQRVTEFQVRYNVAETKVDQLKHQLTQLQANTDQQVMRWRAHYRRRALTYLAVVCRKRPELAQFVPQLWPPSSKEAR